MPTIQEVQNSATIYEFMDRPYQMVRVGRYVPSLFDCWACIADNSGKIFLAFWEKVCELSVHMSILEFFIWIFKIPMLAILTFSYPLLFWLWGTLLYMRLRNERERHKKIQAELDRKLDGLV